MKWVRTAIGAVIAIASIGFIATSVYKMTQPSEIIREVSFEIDYDEGIYYPLSTFNDILEYSVIDIENDSVLNVSIYIDDEIASNVEIVYVDGSTSILFFGELPDLSGDIDFFIDNEGHWYSEGGSWTHDMIVKLVFEVIQPPQITGISATLILLIPIVFIGGVLLYFYKPFKKED